MLKNYLKIAVRSIVNNKIYSSINIIGLAVGLASVFIILLFVLNELSYDRYNENLDNIYLVTTEFDEFNFTSAKTQYNAAKLLKDQLPEIVEYARWYKDKRTVVQKSNNNFEGTFIYADPTLFKILTLSIESGNLEEFTTATNSIVISKTFARKYFANDNPVGKILTIQNKGGVYDVKVSAVMSDIPKTSTFQADIILPIQLAESALNKQWASLGEKPLESRTLNIFYTYLLLRPGSDLAHLENQFAEFSKSYSNPDKQMRFGLFPLRNIYFFSGALVNNNFPAGDINNIYIYSIIGFLILLIACTNIVIINTGRASTRTKEVGLRKVVGANRLNLIIQILTESVLSAFLSFFIALFLVEIFLPVLSSLLGNELAPTHFHQWYFIAMFAFLTLIVALLSGSYGSFYLSRCRPIDILKNKMNIGSRRMVFRKSLVVFEMIIFVGLIASVFIIYSQIKYFQGKDFGFNKDNLVVLYPDRENFSNSFESFKNELKTNPGILGVTGGFVVPGSESRGMFLEPNRVDPQKKIPIEGLSVDRDFFEVMSMKLIQGKSFADLTPGELKNSCILNEAAVKELSIKDPIGEIFQDKNIIGVVKDFNMHSLREAVVPTAITEGMDYMFEIVVKASSTNLFSTIEFIKKISSQFNNGKPMDFEFFDERIDNLYKKEMKFYQMIVFFTGLAVFIACMGIFGISLFACRQRVKEIGIRKVSGASTNSIFYLLTKEILILTVVSTIITIPFVYYFANNWLQDYAYRIDISWGVFALAGGMALLIAVATISFQAIKAATANPVDSLKHE